jgi:hypothetical protein
MREEATGRTIEIYRIHSAHFSRPARKNKIVLPVNYLQRDAAWT